MSRPHHFRQIGAGSRGGGADARSDTSRGKHSAAKFHRAAAQPCEWFERRQSDEESEGRDGRANRTGIGQAERRRKVCRRARRADASAKPGNGHRFDTIQRVIAFALDRPSADCYRSSAGRRAALPSTRSDLPRNKINRPRTERLQRMGAAPGRGLRRIERQ